MLIHLLLAIYQVSISGCLFQVCGILNERRNNLFIHLFSVEDGEKALADEEVFVEERIASLNTKLDQTGPSALDEEGEQLDQFENVS